MHTFPKKLWVNHNCFHSSSDQITTFFYKMHCSFPSLNLQCLSSVVVSGLLSIVKVTSWIPGSSRICLENFFKFQLKIAFFKRAFQGLCSFPKCWVWYIFIGILSLIFILILGSFTRKKFSLGLHKPKGSFCFKVPATVYWCNLWLIWRNN